jgi:hypothetical protein
VRACGERIGSVSIHMGSVRLGGVEVPRVGAVSAGPIAARSRSASTLKEPNRHWRHTILILAVVGIVVKEHRAAAALSSFNLSGSKVSVVVDFSSAHSSSSTIFSTMRPGRGVIYDVVA